MESFAFHIPTRFTREAQILASLNHPNIAQIHGIEEAEGTRALVLELVEGPTLADRISKGPIPLDEALPIAKQIAEALEAAHEAGVIHRDLKPANIKVRDDGTVKVLDFGLAKALDPAPDVDPSQSPTLTAAATQMGVILGTAAYMSPEQAKGKTADRRSDVWAFGAVLYEMLSGRRAFVGEDVSDTLVSVFRDEPDWSRLSDDVPARVRQALQVCLQKEPKQRVRDVAAVRLAMEGAFETTVSTASTPTGAPELRVWQRPVAIAVPVLAAAVLTGLTVWSLTRPVPPAPRPLAQFVLQRPPDGPLLAAGTTQVAISPDGTRVVYGSGQGAQDRRLFVRLLGELDATPLRGTEGGDAPFFSPDGQSVGFRVDSDGALKQVSVLGGPAVTIVEADRPRGVSWGPDDTIVFGSRSGLMRVRTAGGEPEPLTTVDPARGEIGHVFPHILPNLKGVLFTAWSGSDEASRLAVVSLETGAVSDLLPGGSHPRYAPTGHIVYGVGNTLRAVGFDANRLELTSTTPVPVVENVSTTTGGAANFGLADNGTLVYVMRASAGVGRPERSLVWVDREGREEPLSTPVESLSSPRVSPDGTQVAFRQGSPDGGDIWIHDLVRGTETLLTTDPANDFAPLWTPDGERVVFGSDREGPPALFQKLADTPGAAERLMTASPGTFIQPTSWSADGQTLLYWEVGAATRDIGKLSMEGDRAAELLLDTAASESMPAVSPKGDWIAYESNETQQPEVYVQRFPTLGGKQTISTDGGRQPLWSPDGRELFYRTLTGVVMVVPVLDTEPTFSAGGPEVLIETPYPLFSGRDRTYDIHPDGQRFLMVKEASTADRQIILIENWFEELKRLVPTN